MSELVFRELIKRLDIYTELLKRKETGKILEDVSSVTQKYIQPRSKYDLYSICPYDSSTSTKYNCSYFNASFIRLPGCNFIACQRPLEAYISNFCDFLRKSNIKVVLSLNSDAKGIFCVTPKSTKEVHFNDELFILDELYKMSALNSIDSSLETVTRIQCLKWKDHGTLSVDQMDMLYEYMETLFEKRGMKMKRVLDKKAILDYIDSLTTQSESIIADEDYCVVHCRAGVGRTGTYILYKILKGIGKVNEREFLKLFLFLRSRRPYMVETVKQFNFLLDCFLEPEDAL